MLRLTKNRRIKYISLHISLDAKFWDFDKSRPKRNCPDKERINTLIETKTKELQEQILDFKTSDKEYTLNTLLEKASRKVVRQTVCGARKEECHLFGSCIRHLPNAP